MTEYRVDAYARVPYAAFIHADSLEEAWEIAEKEAKEYSEYSPSNFTMSCDSFSLKVDSVTEQKSFITKEQVEASLRTPMYYEEEEEEAPPKVIDIPKRDFIPGWDD